MFDKTCQATHPDMMDGVSDNTDMNVVDVCQLR